MAVLSTKFTIFVQGDGQEQGRFYQQDGDDRVLAPSHNFPSGRSLPPQRRRCRREAVQGGVLEHDSEEFKRSENDEVPLDGLCEISPRISSARSSQK